MTVDPNLHLAYKSKITWFSFRAALYNVNNNKSDDNISWLQVFIPVLLSVFCRWSGEKKMVRTIRSNVKMQLKITHRDISKIYINRDPIDNDHLPDFILLSSAKVLTFKFWWFYFLKNWEKIYYTDKNMNFEHMDSFYIFRRKPRVGKYTFFSFFIFNSFQLRQLSLKPLLWIILEIAFSICSTL